MMNIYPAILTDSLELVQEQITRVSKIEKISLVQIDVIDGYFADNITVTPMDLVDVNFHNLQVDFHLMTEEPLSYAEEIVGHKKYFPVRAVIGQVEKMSSQEDFVTFLEEKEVKKGLSLDIFTPHEEILDSVLKRLDCVQLMAIEAGEQGRTFNDLVLKKIEDIKARAIVVNPELEIIVDGGVKLDNIDRLEKAEVTSVGVGSALWKSDTIDQTIERFLEYAN